MIPQSVQLIDSISASNTKYNVSEHDQSLRKKRCTVIVSSDLGHRESSTGDWKPTFRSMTLIPAGLYIFLLVDVRCLSGRLYSTCLPKAPRQCVYEYDHKCLHFLHACILLCMHAWRHQKNFDFFIYCRKYRQTREPFSVIFYAAMHQCDTIRRKNTT